MYIGEEMFYGIGLRAKTPSDAERMRGVFRLADDVLGMEANIVGFL